MTASFAQQRRSLERALGDGRLDAAAEVARAAEHAATAALATGEIGAVVSARGRLTRLRRAGAAADPDWDGVERMLVLDRALASAITGFQVALRRDMELPIAAHVTDAARRSAPRVTIRQRVLEALDDKPRRPVELGQRAGVPKRQLQRALAELVAAGKARPVAGAAEDERAAFYQRVA